jgi:hypothetical protein
MKIELTLRKVFFFGATILLIVGVLFVRPQPSNYERILAKLTQEEVKGAEGYTPVFIFFNDMNWASGVLWNYQGSQRIVTVAHTFPEGVSGYYTYQVLRPFSEERLPINRKEALGELHNQGFDLALCYPGEKAIIMSREGKQGFDQAIEGFKCVDAQPPLSGLIFTSLLTGKAYPCQVIWQGAHDGKGYPVMAYGLPYSDVIPSESGSGFMASDGRTLIISRGYEVRSAIYDNRPVWMAAGSLVRLHQ